MMRPSRFLKAVVLLNCAVPVALLGWDAWHGDLGANPVNFAIRTTGLLSLIFLILTLAITPIGRLAHLSWLGPFRRMMGLCAFFHAALHFGIFFAFDRNGSASDTVSEILKRPYLLVGTTGLVLMVPLAATSTDSMIRRLGGRRWKLLHRLAYVAAIAGAVHFAMLVKADLSRPIAFATVLGIFLGYRLVAHYLRLRSDSRKFRASPTSTIAPARPAFWKGSLRVARVFDETPDVRTFRMVPPEGGRLPFEHRPGQYLNVSLSVDGKTVRRSYTIASSPTRAGSCEITVKREELGVSSRHLHDAIREGSLIEVSAPSGRFTFAGDDAEGIVLIAGGVGITPMMAKIRYLTDIGWPGPIDLIFAAKTERDIIFREELDYLRKRFPNLRVHLILSREAGETWSGERGRISSAMLARAVPEIAARRVHICGPAEMMDAVTLLLIELGVPEDQVRVESFTAARGRQAETNGEGHVAPALSEQGMASITFARSGKSRPITGSQTVLEAAEELGVAMAYDCRAGICGQCKTKLLEGRVAMDAEDALDPMDRAGGLILSCQARCLDAVIVDA